MSDDRWIPNLMGPVTWEVNGAEQTPRGTIAFEGDFSRVDDAANDTLRIIIEPTTGATGATGATGPPGATGPAGPGPTGSAGDIPTSNGAGGFGDPLEAPTGDLVGTTDTQTLTNKVIDSPEITGTPFASTTHGSVLPVLTEVSTSSTSPTTCGSYGMGDESLVAFDVIVVCVRATNATKGGRYKRSVVYRRTGGGAPTIVGTLESGTDQETTSGDGVTIDVSSNDVRVRVTAADSDPRYWMSEICVRDMSA